MIGHIYKVTNKINGKVYIGQTIQNVKDRWYRHCGYSGLSKKEMNMHIKRAILKYGKENFIVETLEDCDVSELDDREKYYIEFYNSYKEGYNSTTGGYDGLRGLHTPEDKQKDIVDLYKYGFSLDMIAREFHIDHATVRSILTRKGIAIRKTKTYKLSTEDRKQIVQEAAKGVTRKEIMKKYNISKSYLSQLISGNRRI